MLVTSDSTVSCHVLTTNLRSYTWNPAVGTSKPTQATEDLKSDLETIFDWQTNDETTRLRKPLARLLLLRRPSRRNDHEAGHNDHDNGGTYRAYSCTRWNHKRL